MIFFFSLIKILKIIYDNHLISASKVVVYPYYINTNHPKYFSKQYPGELQRARAYNKWTPRLTIELLACWWVNRFKVVTTPLYILWLVAVQIHIKQHSISTLKRRLWDSDLLYSGDASWGWESGFSSCPNVLTASTTVLSSVSCRPLRKVSVCSACICGMGEDAECSGWYAVVTYIEFGMYYMVVLLTHTVLFFAELRQTQDVVWILL